MMVADFTWSCRSCSGVFRLWGSCRGLAVLGSCSLGVHHPLGAGAAIWVTENLRGSSLGQPTSEGQPENVGGSFHSLAKLVAAFLGCMISAWSWQSYAADPLGLGTPWGLWRVAGLLKTQKAPPRGSLTQKNHPRIRQIYSWPG